jgi:hypothetical protein
MRRPLLIIAFALLATNVFAQVNGDDVIRVDTQLVDVPMAVVSPAGVPLKGLKASNFVIYEDGKKQETVDFSTPQLRSRSHCCLILPARPATIFS